MVELKDIIASPNNYFKSPKQLFENTELSKQDKIKAFNNWIDEEKRFSIADEENMAGSELQDNEMNKLFHELHKYLNKLLENHAA